MPLSNLLDNLLAPPRRRNRNPLLTPPFNPNAPHPLESLPEVPPPEIRPSLQDLPSTAGVLRRPPMPEHPYRGRLEGIYDELLAPPEKPPLWRNILARVAGGMAQDPRVGAGILHGPEMRRRGELQEQEGILSGILGEDEKMRQGMRDEEMRQSRLQSEQALTSERRARTQGLLTPPRPKFGEDVPFPPEVEAQKLKLSQRAERAPSVYEDFRAGYPDTPAGRAKAARDWRAQQGRGGGQKPTGPTPVQKAAAERRKQSALMKLEQEFRQRRSETGVPDLRGPMPLDELQLRKQEIQDAYEAELEALEAKVEPYMYPAEGERPAGASAEEGTDIGPAPAGKAEGSSGIDRTDGKRVVVRNGRLIKLP